MNVVARLLHEFVEEKRFAHCCHHCHQLQLRLCMTNVERKLTDVHAVTGLSCYRCMIVSAHTKQSRIGVISCQTSLQMHRMTQTQGRHAQVSLAQAIWLKQILLKHIVSRLCLFVQIDGLQGTQMEVPSRWVQILRCEVGSGDLVR